MSAFTDRLYREWRKGQGNGGRLLTTGHPALPSKTNSQKAESRDAATPRPPVHTLNVGGSKHGIREV